MVSDQQESPTDSETAGQAAHQEVVLDEMLKDGGMMGTSAEGESTDA